MNRTLSFISLKKACSFFFTYLYDGGEGWEPEIALEEVIRNGLEDDIPVCRWCAGMAGGGGDIRSLSITADVKLPVTAVSSTAIGCNI